MKQIAIKQIKYFIVAFLALFFIGGRPVEFGKENLFFHGFLIPKPVIKVGLGINLSDIHIRSSSGMKVYEVGKDYRLLADDVDEIRIKGGQEKLSEKFLLLAAQTKGREGAELIAQEVRAKISNNVYVEENPEFKLNGIFEVKVGDFLTRGDALSFIQTLENIGIRDAWIIREEITAGAQKPRWLLINDELKSLSDETVLYFIPSNPQSYLSLNGRSYRGIMTLKTSSKGIVLVNVLNIEDYLKAVVPGELSPSSFNELEALKAQAVAARTYAIKNQGQYKDLGFDLLDTPQSQLYSGMSIESPLSTKAVEETSGEVVLYKGEMIDSLYTSTCGGKTENVENVFGGKSLPYLRSTECLYERQPEWTLETKGVSLPILVKGRDSSSRVAFLVSLNVLPYETNPAFYSQDASFEETVAWLRSALVLMGKREHKFSSSASTLNYVSLAELLVTAFQWKERVDNLMLGSEVEYILKDFPKITGPGRSSVAYLIQSGIYPASEDVGRIDRPLTRAEVVNPLYKIISGYKDFYHQGIFRGASKDKIEVGEEFERKQLTLSPQIFLLRILDGQGSFAQRLSLLGGETIRWLEKEGEVRLLEVNYPPNTNILDRSSKLHRWEIRKSREDLEAKIGESYSLGHLVDIEEHKRSDSKRVSELLIKGTDKQIVVSGLKVRWVLGLKDTLFVIDREYDGEGRVSHFIFSGKGWGHGVGLCQVGAFGMAQAGALYQEILKKYYHGIKIKKIY